MAYTDSDSVYSVMSDSGAQSDPSAPPIPKRIKLALAGARIPATSPDYGSETDPNPDPSVDPSPVVAASAPPSSPSKEANAVAVAGAGADGNNNSSERGSVAPAGNRYGYRSASSGTDDFGSIFLPSDDEQEEYERARDLLTTPPPLPRGDSSMLFSANGRAVESQPGGIRGLFAKLGRGLGILSPQLPTDPRTGQAPSRNDFNAGQKSRFGRFMQAVGGLGGALAAAGGTPEQQQLAERRSEFERELPLQHEQILLEQARLANEARYQQGMLGVRSRQEDINQQKANTGDRRAALMYAKEGLHPDGTPMSENEIESVPFLRESLDLKNAQAAKARADQELAQARATSEPEKVRIAQQHATIAEQMMGLALQNYRLRALNASRQEREFAINFYGIDPATGAPPPGAVLDQNGNPVGQKFAGRVAPTNSARSKAEQASTILDVANNELIPMIRANADQLGPVMGRYNSLEDFIGDPPPEFAQTAAALQSWIALHPAAHGFKGLNAVREFEKAFGSPIRSPEALIAAIQGSFGTMRGLQRTGTPRTASAPAGGVSQQSGSIRTAEDYLKKIAAGYQGRKDWYVDQKTGEREHLTAGEAERRGMKRLPDIPGGKRVLHYNPVTRQLE